MLFQKVDQAVPDLPQLERRILVEVATKLTDLASLEVVMKHYAEIRPEEIASAVQAIDGQPNAKKSAQGMEREPSAVGRRLTDKIPGAEGP